MNNIIKTPPMGWNSWNTFYDGINEKLIFEMADAMVEQGFRDAGYEYLVIDDCWQARSRDEKGNLVPDREKFPHGMRAVSDYVHAKGLKFGLYSCCGVRTCAGYPGSFEHEYEDAARFADWGVDYLKYDNCSRPAVIPSEILYRRMSMALKSTGREITLAACQWGTEGVYKWAGSSGVHTYRSTVDIQDAWASIESIARERIDNLCFGGYDCFNDMDMLVVGMHGGGGNPETSLGGCTDEEYQTHFALWAMLNSPLIIGCDIREMTPETRKILLNKDMIAINQDPACRSCYKLTDRVNPDVFVLVKPLAAGDYAVGLFNFSDTAFGISVNLWELGLTVSSGRKAEFYDCLAHESRGIVEEYFNEKVNAHGCRVYRCRV